VPEKSASCLTSSRLTARNAFTARSFEWGLAHAEISQFSARQPLFGRPNIIGHVSSFVSWEDGTFDGVLIKYDGGNANVAGGQGEAIGATVGFDAHNGNSSFGASETVQPPALLGLACIKT
jgi:hypothetical protein